MTNVSTPSAVENLIASSISTSAAHPEYLQALALEVQHNLQHQHDWEELCIHTTSSKTGEPLMRPLVSGIPPRRVYIHPDEQIQLIKAGIKDEDVEPQREWVLPSRLVEKWSLRKFGMIFDAIEHVPNGPEDPSFTEPDEWRQIKRLLLATVDDDSTVTYYVVHDGIVKPRQN